LVFASADSAPELMKLRQAETVGAFNHHNAGIGNIDADFNHRSGNKDIYRSGRKFFHYFLFLSGLEAAMKQSYFQIGKNFF